MEEQGSRKGAVVAAASMKVDAAAEAGRRGESLCIYGGGCGGHQWVGWGWGLGFGEGFGSALSPCLSCERREAGRWEEAEVAVSVDRGWVYE